MGFFSLKAECAVCGNEASLNRYQIANKQWMCSSCMKKIGFIKIGQAGKPITKMTPDDIRDLINGKINNENELDSFKATKKIGKYIEFDDKQEKWLVLSAILGRRNNSKVYNYSDIVDFELLEDGESVASGGLGRALVGGALFGGAGAVVGAVTGKKKAKGVCTSLKLKITVNDFNNPAVYINFITASTKKNSFLYKTVMDDAQECLSTFQLICERQKEEKAEEVSHNTVSAADEIKKFKELLDAGILSQEEFDAKKKELLGL